MKKQLIALTIFALIVAVSTYFVVKQDKTKENLATAPTPTATRYTFEELGISFEVPYGLDVIKTPMPNPEDPTKLDSYLFYIQHKAGMAGPETSDFQIYGMFQFGLPKVTWEQFSELTNDTETYAYTKEIELSGIRGYEAQFKGERNNFLYMFHFEGNTLRLSVSPATDENKMVADKIVKSLQVVGGLNMDQ